MSPRSVVLHSHFYQPPRENPWTGEVEAEANAAPFHDWNERVAHECYGPVTAARIGEGASARALNTLEWMSFDVGPTLLAWMARERPAILEAIVRADRASAARLGHGNAIAMPYHHVILPLCSRRDKVTEVRWGVADFRRRFAREPAGMWLPETAVDEETLDVLAAEGIAFTILAPHQVAAPPALGLPGRFTASRGRSLALFVYDGPLAHGVAFGPLLSDSRRFEERLLATPTAEVVSLATDGETYGHHHKFGEMALAALLDRLRRRADVRVENYAAFLARRPPVADVALIAPSSWSCPHGVERWRRDCGCKAAPERPSQQGWRAPLREAIDWLTREVHALYESGAGGPAEAWAARDAAGGGSVVRPEGRSAAALEMERSVLASATSCGWFFDDFAGHEGRVVLQYAARALALAGPAAPRLESGFLERLALAVSNDPAVGSGRDFYLLHAVSRAA